MRAYSPLHSTAILTGTSLVIITLRADGGMGDKAPNNSRTLDRRLVMGHCLLQYLVCNKFARVAASSRKLEPNRAVKSRI